MFFIKPINVS